MSSGPYRLATGGAIDRDVSLRFTFDGHTHDGHPGDTLASALLAGGMSTVGRSFKYHRPRGVLGIGPEEPNALVTLGDGASAEPNTRATMIQLSDGLVATSQNRWPNLAFDVAAINNRFSAFLSAGFYYKTFMGPSRGAWRFYEHFIRKAAGLGNASREPDPSSYEKRYAHADVLVVGGGVAGLSAALAAARTGARVILADERHELGGWLRHERMGIDGRTADDWIDRLSAELASLPEVTLLPRTTAFGYYDHNLVGAVEMCSGAVHHRLWRIRARHVVLAAGAIEQPILFPGNDRPGVMLAGAVRGYANRYGVATGRRVAIHTATDDAYRTAFDLTDAGVAVAAVLDTRSEAAPYLAERLGKAGVRLVTNARIAGTRFRGTLRGIDVLREGGSAQPEFIDCDCVAISGGLAPAVHLSSQSGARAAYDASIGAFVPGMPKQRQSNAGAMAANFDVAAAIRSGLEAGRQASEACGLVPSDVSDVAKEVSGVAAGKSFCYAPARVTRKQAKKTFVDLQNDVTMADIMQARLEGYDSPEHMKRYTTLGMATDQGKTSGIPAMHAAAVLQGMTPDERGTTTFRPPYTPVSFGALAGIERGQHYQHLRRTPLQDWHEAHGGRLVETGAWRRPQAYPRRRESLADAITRETRNVREAVGICDVSTLGKIEVQGPDAETFLDRIYCTRVSGMAVGRARYGLMLREDGFVFDDGTLARLSPSRFYLTTTTANAERVLRHMEFHAQAIWPELRVRMTSVSDQFSAIAVAGPRSRALLERVVAGSDLTNAAMPHMSVRQVTIAGEPARLLRVSYSGELAYEVHVGADHCEAVWQQLLADGAGLGVMPYGLEAMGTLRIEKGHVAGAEIDGRTTPADLGLGALVKAGGDFIGRRMLERQALLSPDRMQLVGLVPADDVSRISGGAVLTEAADATPPVLQIGHVTSTATSPMLGKPIALGLASGGLSRWRGRTLFAQSPVRGGTVLVKVVDPVFFDQKGERTRV